MIKHFNKLILLQRIIWWSLTALSIITCILLYSYKYDNLGLAFWFIWIFSFIFACYTTMFKVVTYDIDDHKIILYCGFIYDKLFIDEELRTKKSSFISIKDPVFKFKINDKELTIKIGTFKNIQTDIKNI